MERAKIQIEDEVREMTEEEHNEYIEMSKNSFKVPDVVA